MIELDVQLSREQELVVIHDFELERTTSGHGSVREHRLEELKALDAGGWFGKSFVGEPILTLDEVTELVAPTARLNVELKATPPDSKVLAERVVTFLRQRNLLESTLISCFEPETLATVRAIASDARIGLLWQNTDLLAAWRWTSRLAAVSFHPVWALVSDESVNEAHARNLQVITWTVNEVDLMRRLVDCGVDGIISDFPERFAAVLA